MAGYTAANNIFGFLYAAANSITQACMSFTSQNYGAGKWKRMDKVLRNCILLSVVVSLILGGGSYLFGPELLKIYTSDPKVIQCGMEILLYTTVTYFMCGLMDSSRRAARNGIFCNSDASFYHRNSRNEDCLDLHDLPSPQIIGCFVYLLSRIMAYHDHTAGNLLFLRKKKDTQSPSLR